MGKTFDMYIGSQSKHTLVRHQADRRRGPNWIHGSKDNPILRIAKEMKDVCFEPPDGGDVQSPVFDKFGNEIDTKVALNHSAISWEIVEEAIQYSRSDRGASIPPGKSLKDYFEVALSVREYDASMRNLILEMADMWGNIVGEPIDKQSLRYIWLEECIEGGEISELRMVLESQCILTSRRELVLGKLVQIHTE